MIWKTFLKKNRNHHAQVFYSSRRRVWTVKWMSRLASWWMRLLFILDLAAHPASHLFNAQPSPLPHPCTTREIARRFRQIRPHLFVFPFCAPSWPSWVMKKKKKKNEDWKWSTNWLLKWEVGQGKPNDYMLTLTGLWSWRLLPPLKGNWSGGGWGGGLLEPKQWLNDEGSYKGGSWMSF